MKRNGADMTYPHFLLDTTEASAGGSNGAHLILKGETKQGSLT
jgi:hypothetical protein